MNEYLNAVEVKTDILRIAEAAINNNSSQNTELSAMKARIDEIREQQVRLLDLLLEYMDDEDLNARMLQLTEEKKSLESAILSIQSETQELKVERWRLEELQHWAEEHQAGFKEYDDLYVRKLIKEIIVISSTQIRILFVEKTEMDVELSP